MSNYQLRDKNQGSILLVMAILLALLAGFGLTFIKAPNKLPQIRHDRNALVTADQQLRSFMAFNGRLPCPDTNGDGREDCDSTATKGNLPYLTLGLKETGYRAGDVALRYGLYRRVDDTVVSNTLVEPAAFIDAFSPLGSWDPWGLFPSAVTTYANDADLGVLKNRYEPTTADSLQMNTANQNTVDLCVALQNGAGATTDSTYTYIQSTAGTNNVAYAIAAAGYTDSDNQNGLFDGLNGSSTVGFNSSENSSSFEYDDQVVSRSFADLQNDMQCDVIINSLNLMADAVHSQYDVAGTSASIKVATIVGAVMANVTLVAINGYAVLLAVKAAAAATAALTAASADLAAATAAETAAIAAEAAAIAACAATGVGCLAVPAATAAVATATAWVAEATAAVAAGVAAEAAAATAVVLNVVAVTAQLAATAAYDAIAIAALVVLPSPYDAKSILIQADSLGATQ
jgi:type II secretory pathway pseudopilin PulG